MVAKSSPSIFHTHLKYIIDIWFGHWDKEENMLPRTPRKSYSKEYMDHNVANMHLSIKFSHGSR
ncbi:hypothetical protein SETIT_3G295100v2 [Setaria italica]|uniref:Uncharacterized protein n=2 Tax=Setaria TaxID=4554 RepID=A0A368QKM2_SETIT|nr:hypothetical protein SETIT_3G295100v2 [Setaria italica]TKW28121.1 hypothetical protein SEVIR_3G304900v2 [Setaria viridis]